MPKNPADKFSDASKEMIAYGHDICHDLGAECFEPIHLLLADYYFAVQIRTSTLFIRSEEQFKRVLEQNRVGEPIVIMDNKNFSLPLSIAIQVVIRNSLKIAKKMKAELVEPFHMFLALETLQPEFFHQFVPESEKGSFMLKEYYIERYGPDLFYVPKAQPLAGIGKFFRKLFGI
jgi:hypothetical protein